jgi:hypothetical protein
VVAGVVAGGVPVSASSHEAVLQPFEILLHRAPPPPCSVS